jgi:hypothetical protein
MAPRTKRRRTTGGAAPREGNSTRTAAVDTIALGLVIAVAAVLLFWRLGSHYLWQDEANTAVLAVRMLKFGKPLAYDGVNLLTSDNFAAESQDQVAARTTSPQAGVDYVVKRGDLKPDTAWIFQPWGQFVAAGASIKLLGQTTLAARLPFAVAAFAAVILVFWLVRDVSGNLRLAVLATALLTLNAGWILHSRQSRYYALSGLLFVVTLIAFERWQRGARWGAPLFVAAAWTWFQVDYGTVWPVLAVLFIRALISNLRDWWRTLLVGAAFAVAVLPFVYYYQLTNRFSAQLGSWSFRFGENFFYMDRYLIPLFVWIAALVLIAWRWRKTDTAERRFILTLAAILPALALWIPAVVPAAVVRYLVMAAPATSILIAWVLLRGAGAMGSFALVLATAIVVLTPWLSGPFGHLAPNQLLVPEGVFIRPELSGMVKEIFVPRKDPNRAVVEWLRQNAKPTDEILVNYEDIPLMYYLPNPIRGGVAAFRAEDDSKGPPAFVVMRSAVRFVHWPVFMREIARYKWEPVPIDAPDVVWGNNPDPMGKLQDPDTRPPLQLARRR